MKPSGSFPTTFTDRRAASTWCHHKPDLGLGLFSLHGLKSSLCKADCQGLSQPQEYGVKVGMVVVASGREAVTAWASSHKRRRVALRKASNSVR